VNGAPASRAPSTKPAPARRRQTHTVRKGETLYRIATRYGVSVEDLRRENRLARSNSLRVGQRLSVPQASGR
jgi:LysM repeat protein